MTGTSRRARPTPWISAPLGSQSSKSETRNESSLSQVSGLSQLAAGIAGGLAAGNSLGAVTGAQAGKNAVENNALIPKSGCTPLTCKTIVDPFEGGGGGIAGGGSRGGGKAKDKQIWSETKKKEPVSNAYGHWDKHKNEFPEFQNSKQYVDATHNFVTMPPSGTLIKTRPNGDTIYYNPKTNTFASKDAKGVPRTMFKPEKGMEYWNKQ